jgi:hypothetical protein
MKSSSGHLIIHDISKLEAAKLMKTLLNNAHWWPQEEIDKLDQAAAFAMLTHEYPKTKDKNLIEFNKKENEK